jgi:formamidopyrimidine-DNA glycosylase
MPELPEVETARRIIEQSVVGARLTAIEVRLPKMLRISPIQEPDTLLNATLLAARRRAKVLILPWSNGLTTLIHLKLSGQVSAQRNDERHTAGHPYPDPLGVYPHKTTHISLTFDNGWDLHISDLRQFGWFQIVLDDQVEQFLAAQSFGPEANELSGTLTDQFATKLGRRSVPIKTVLLDQKVIAGVGNIYVDEALHRAKIHPATPANAIRSDQLPGLLAAIKWSIDSGIAIGGAKIINNKATMINGFPEVHARAGEACPVCGDTIVKIRVGQRGTYFCPTCQPPPE